MNREKLFRLVILLAALLMAAWPITASAASSSSANYSVNETFFGAGGLLAGSSTNYQAKESLGETGVGNTSSANYQVWAGFNTTEQPFLAFVVNSATIDLGVLSTATTATATATFSVRAWQASGYVVQNASPGPSNGGHYLTTLTSPTAPSPGTEQFGINLVANTSPSVGANPEECPNTNQCPYSGSPTLSFGVAASGYNTPNLFKYVQGDTIADSTQSTSATLYTVSYIFNINTSTVAGQYNFNHVLVATATY